MEDKSLSISFADSLTDDAISCISDYAEIGLDAIMDDGILKDIPIVSTAIAVYKIGSSIKERYNIKKLLVFLNELNKGIPRGRKRQEYQQKFQSDEKFRNREIEYLLVLIDRYISYDKPRMLANLYLAYLEGVINWETLTVYAEIIDRFLPGDFQELQRGSRYDLHYLKASDALIRLVSMGLLVEHSKGISVNNTCGSLNFPDLEQKDYELTTFGSKLIEILSNMER